MILPKYPIYIISKGRFKNCLTPKFLIQDQVPFYLVVEPQEAEEYIKRYGKEKVLILPFNNLGLGSIPARNWVWEHSIKNGYEKHWILDDNIRYIRRNYKNKRIKCNAGIALKIVEDFTDRYENIAISGLNYTMFGFKCKKPFYLNVHVYSCLLIKNSIPQRWRGKYNEDTDLCLQVLASNQCTILINSFLIDKIRTLTMKGGNTTELYKSDGRLKMANSLKRQWPKIVKVIRRFKRPQHLIKNNWNKFDTPLILKPETNLEELKKIKYEMKIIQIKTIKNENLKKMIDTNLLP